MNLAPKCFTSISSIFLLFVILLSFHTSFVECQEDVYILEQQPTQTSLSTNEQQNGGFSGHIVALRPDYTFWRMVNVLKTMFDTRTAEKRRPSRELDDQQSSEFHEIPSLRARRLLLNFGRFRV